ncbi:hypothetical protein M885DRAFT_510206 [Pelagophyceae sp. CCMP2097]|nr:hypothetical protein M885DRAFT_510206 [Pelagophyceae sp. CCMP2097]|mmetsp:Transcript_26368/g.90675  ORF Transcript_26368/g.90675 Transcript_26368/m.90675 type:complete len:297 (+) Transcript_26368:151-1041(+)
MAVEKRVLGAPLRVALELRLLSFALAAALATSVALTANFKVTNGCAAQEQAKQNGRAQISNLMCCPTAYYISLCGFGATALLTVAAAASRRTLRAASAALGSCCCCERCRAGLTAGVVTGLAGIGLGLLAVFDMCDHSRLHGAGAFLFFAGGYALIGIVAFSWQSKPISKHAGEDGPSKPTRCAFALSTARLWVPEGASPQLLMALSVKPTALFLAALAVAMALSSRIVAKLALLAEWAAILGIAFAVLALQLDVLLGDQILRGEAVECASVFDASLFDDSAPIKIELPPDAAGQP